MKLVVKAYTRSYWWQSQNGVVCGREPLDVIKRYLKSTPTSESQLLTFLTDTTSELYKMVSRVYLYAFDRIPTNQELETLANLATE